MPVFSPSPLRDDVICKRSIFKKDLHFGTSNWQYIYWKTTFISHNQHLFALLFSSNTRKTHKDQSIQKCLTKSFFLSVYLLEQLPSVNVFCSMWLLKGITFYTNLSLPREIWIFCVMYNKDRYNIHVKFWSMCLFDYQTSCW